MDQEQRQNQEQWKTAKERQKERLKIQTSAECVPVTQGNRKEGRPGRPEQEVMKTALAGESGAQSMFTQLAAGQGKPAAGL